MTFIDTAPLYGVGVSERRLGQVLAERPRTSYVLAAKVGRLVADDGTVSFDFSRDGTALMQALLAATRVGLADAIQQGFLFMFGTMILALAGHRRSGRSVHASA